MKYTMSRDGTHRATLAIKIRLTKKELEGLKDEMHRYGCEPTLAGVRSFLKDCLHIGIQRVYETEDEDDES